MSFIKATFPASLATPQSPDVIAECDRIHESKGDRLFIPSQL
jgi:hypothetical protein